MSNTTAHTSPARPALRRRAWAIGLALAASCCVWPGLAQAQEAWPTRPIRIVVGFAPGGAADFVARTVSDPLARVLGQAGVVLDSDRLNAARLGCVDRDHAVASPQVDQYITRPDPGHLKHFLGQTFAGGQPHHVFAHLPALGLVIGGAGAAAQQQ